MAASPAPSVRAFIGIALDAGLASEIQKVQRQLAAGLPDGAVRWVRPEQLHLTLKFLGDVSQNRLNDLAAAVERACTGTAPFQLRLEGAGCFPHAKKPRIVWVGIAGALESLGALQDRIARETPDFGDHTENRAFRPHLTIGRVNAFGASARDLGERVDRAGAAALGEWSVREIHLVQSELSPGGARYTTLATVRLRRGDEGVLSTRA